MNNTPLSVGSVAAESTLVGDLLRGETLGDGVGLVNDLGWGPDGLPWLGGGLHFAQRFVGLVRSLSEVV